MTAPLWLLAGLACGAAVACAVWLASRGRVASLQHALDDARSERVAATDKLLVTEKELERMRTQLDADRSSFAEKIGLLEQAKTGLSDAFRALSAEALKSNNEQFLQLAKSQLEGAEEKARHELETRQKAVETLVSPLRDSLTRVDSKLQDLERARIASYVRLDEQVRAMAGEQRELRTETSALVNALRAPSVRGRWGEIQLRRVVELAGMLNRCDFVEQASALGDGGRLRPDVIVRLPGGKNIVIDAKAPLQGYLAAVDATAEEVRVARLQDHARQIRDHMQKLSQKGYWEQFQPTPEFVFMFLPGESFFSAALEQDPRLIEEGVERRVILATPTTLIALLRAVSYGWQQETLADNAREISELGKTLHQRLGVFAEHLGKVGRHLRGSVDSYNEAVGSFESRVLVSARRFVDHGVDGGRDLVTLPVVEAAPRPVQAPELAADNLGVASADAA